jgi:Zinc finger, C2H2 type
MAITVFETQGQPGEQPRQAQGGKLKCPVCDMEFDTQDQLDEHMRMAHGM